MTRGIRRLAAVLVLAGMVGWGTQRTVHACVLGLCDSAMLAELVLVVAGITEHIVLAREIASGKIDEWTSTISEIAAPVSTLVSDSQEWYAGLGAEGLETARVFEDLASGQTFRDLWAARLAAAPEVTEAEYEAALVLTGMDATVIAEELVRFREVAAHGQRREAEAKASAEAVAGLVTTVNAARDSNNQGRNNNQKSAAAVQQAIKAASVTQTELLIGIGQVLALEAQRRNVEEVDAGARRKAFLDRWRQEVTTRYTAIAAQDTRIRAQATRHRELEQINLFPEFGGPGY